MRWDFLDYAHLGPTLLRNVLSVPVTPTLCIMPAASFKTLSTYYQYMECKIPKDLNQQRQFDK